MNNLITHEITANTHHSPRFLFNHHRRCPLKRYPTETLKIELALTQIKNAIKLVPSPPQGPKNLHRTQLNRKTTHLPSIAMDAIDGIPIHNTDPHQTASRHGTLLEKAVPMHENMFINRGLATVCQRKVGKAPEGIWKPDSSPSRPMGINGVSATALSDEANYGQLRIGRYRALPGLNANGSISQHTVLAAGEVLFDACLHPKTNPNAN